MFSTLICRSLRILVVLPNHKNVTLVWVPEHRQQVSNEVADQLPREDFEIDFAGFELRIGIIKTVVHGNTNSIPSQGAST
ncbi:hypothetical protein Trydic_g3919 [Trypoxylus dichotomus]